MVRRFFFDLTLTRRWQAQSLLALTSILALSAVETASSSAADQVFRKFASGRIPQERDYPTGPGSLTSLRREAEKMKTGLPYQLGSGRTSWAGRASLGQSTPEARSVSGKGVTMLRSRSAYLFALAVAHARGRRSSYVGKWKFAMPSPTLKRRRGKRQ